MMQCMMRFMKVIFWTASRKEKPDASSEEALARREHSMDFREGCRNEQPLVRTSWKEASVRAMIGIKRYLSRDQ
jgi:hypothetical protein